MRRTALVSASTLGFLLVLLVAGGPASGWILPPSFPQPPLSDHAANGLPLPPSASEPPVPSHCVRFPEPTNCKHANVARTKARAGLAPRVVDCSDRTAAHDPSTQLRSCDRRGEGYVLVFGR